jgi:large subunit ribosomal protein L4
MRRGALRSALSERLREGNLVVVEEFVLGQPKTKEFVGALSALGAEGKTLVVDTIDNGNLVLAARNVKGAKVVGAGGVNIYDVLYHEKLVMSRSAAEQLQAQLDPKKSGAATADNEQEGEAAAGAQEEEAA